MSNAKEALEKCVFYPYLMVINVSNAKEALEKCVFLVDEHAFPPTGFLWLGSAVRYIWWQRWDDDNCQNGVALPM